MKDLFFFAQIVCIERGQIGYGLNLFQYTYDSFLSAFQETDFAD